MSNMPQTVAPADITVVPALWLDVHQPQWG
jgi:hypothetical protein